MARSLEEFCELESVGDGLLKCRRAGCGRELRTRAKADRVWLVCAAPPVAAPTPGPKPRSETFAEAGPCVHRGAVVERAPCGTCSQRGQVANVYACAKHGRCTLRNRGIKGATNCLSCPDHQAPPIPPAVLRLIEGPERTQPAGWANRPDVQDAFRRLFDARAYADPPARPAWAPGSRGIVVGAGGWRFFPSLYVTVHAIRRVGCTLPIEVWYLGDRGEFDPRMAAALAGQGVAWVDAHAVARERGIKRRVLNGWELKAFAVAQSSFESVLWLDADCYPVVDPAGVFDHPRFRADGCAFFPDLPREELRPEQWRLFGLEPRSEPAWESGQFFVDKSKHWAALTLADWLNDHSDYVYSHVYGDKDTFHLAWRAMGSNVATTCARPLWRRVAFLHRGYDDRPLFVHRCRDKFRWIDRVVDGVTIGEKGQGFCTHQNAGTVVEFVRELPLEAFCWDRFRECFDAVMGATK